MSKKLLFSTLMIGAAYVFIETLSWSAIHIIGIETPSMTAIRERRSEVLESKEPRTATAVAATRWEGVVLHPYLGYAGDPVEERFNGYGYRDDEGFLNADEDAVIVAMTGGSVAQSVWKRTKDYLTESISAIPEFSGRRVHVISLGLFGYKQPQQLASVSYYLTLGGRIDILVNLDGFNEIGSGHNIDAFKEGTSHPAYPSPRAWVPLSGAIASPASTAMAGEIRLLREARIGTAQLADSLAFSPTANLAWVFIDRLLGKRILALNDQIVRDVMSRYSANRGATIPAHQVYEYIADLWVRSSAQLEFLGRGNHFSYYHFLQPNQYLPKSKPLTKKERKIALNDRGQFEQNVVAGYPLLQRQAPELSSLGVRFFDLSGIFSEERGEIYVDSCCHTNRRGDMMIAKAIVAAIERDFEQTPCFDSSATVPRQQSARPCRIDAPLRD